MQGLEAFLAAHDLPPSFRRTVEAICEPLADLAAAR